MALSISNSIARRTCALALLFALWSTACSGEHVWADAKQLVVVTIADWDADHGALRTFTRTTDGWKSESAATPVTIGRAGAAWGTGLHPPQPGPQKKEGDGRSPAGVFRIGNAFGYDSSTESQWPYVAMTQWDYCIDVVSSPLYNRIVDERVVGKDAIAGSSEPMRRDIHVAGDHRYKLGFVIEHNSAGASGLGSCIFAHIWKAPAQPTAGCTAMDEQVMRKLVAWLDPRRKPIFVLLPQAEYARLQTAWNLPDLTVRK